MRDYDALEHDLAMPQAHGVAVRGSSLSPGFSQDSGVARPASVQRALSTDARRAGNRCHSLPGAMQALV